MRISQSSWRRYIGTLRAISDKASSDIQKWIQTYAVDDAGQILRDIGSVRDTDGNSFIDYCYFITQEYGNASAAISAQMYDALAELEGVSVPPAEMARNATYHDVAKTVNGVLKTSHNVDEMTGAVTRLVKKVGCDTTLQNAYRDRAQYAWIPAGDTCAYCLALASNGWVNVSARKIKQGYPHAEQYIAIAIVLMRFGLILIRRSRDTIPISTTKCSRRRRSEPRNKDYQRDVGICRKTM